MLLQQLLGFWAQGKVGDEDAAVAGEEE